MILNQVVLETSTEQISAAPEPVEEGRVGSRRFQVAIQIAVAARRSEEVGVPHLVEGP